MVQQPFERETLLDITVNLVPFVMLLFFIALFTVVTPWGLDFVGDPADQIATLYMYGHLLFTVVSLGVITYVAAKFVSRDEP